MVYNKVFNLEISSTILDIATFKDMVRDPAYILFVSMFYTVDTMHFYVLSFFLVHSLVFV